MSARRRPVIALIVWRSDTAVMDWSWSAAPHRRPGRGRAVIEGQGTDRDDQRDLPARPAAGVDEHGLTPMTNCSLDTPRHPPGAPRRRLDTPQGIPGAWRLVVRLPPAVNKVFRR